TSLVVQHMAPTGSRYIQNRGLLHGQAFYTMRLGWGLTILRGLINSYRLRQWNYLWNAIKGYSSARRQKQDHIVNQQEGQYIRRRQRQQLRKKLFGF
ncbi:MAG: hypothetical protein KJN68_08945, partial [Bacteroidia bacterium]|nr:hypothetical protein [Bacteroidia bacterium]